MTEQTSATAVRTGMTESDLQAMRDSQLTEANFQKLLARLDRLEQEVAQMRDRLERQHRGITLAANGMLPLDWPDKP